MEKVSSKKITRMCGFNRFSDSSMWKLPGIQIELERRRKEKLPLLKKACPTKFPYSGKIIQLN